MQFKLKNTFGHQDGSGTVSLIDRSHHDQVRKYPMNLLDNQWTCDIGLGDGRYVYRFLVDDKIPINDPEASCYEESGGEVWSVLVIDHGQKQEIRQQRLYFKSIKVSGMYSARSLGANSSYINGAKTSFVNAQIIVNGGRGVHCVMVVWTDPAGMIFESDEFPLYVEDIPYPVSEINVKLNLKEKKRFYPSGKWTVHVYLDGEPEGQTDFYLDMGYGCKCSAINFTI